MEVSAGWVRATPPGSTTTAAYMILRNPGVSPVTVVGAASAAAEAVEIHDMTMEDGKMSMARREAVELGPGETVHLEPGGAHLMLIGLAGPMAEGSSVELELKLSEGPGLPVELPVSRERPASEGGA